MPSNASPALYGSLDLSGLFNLESLRESDSKRLMFLYSFVLQTDVRTFQVARGFLTFKMPVFLATVVTRVLGRGLTGSAEDS